MSDSLETERERIRAEKARELKRELGGEAPEDATEVSEPIQIRDEAHLESIVESHPLVLVDCYADWCGPCKMLEPTIEALAADSPATIAKVDVDQHPHIAQKLGARGVPTLVFYVDGRAAERLVGVQDRGTLESIIEQHRS